MVICFGLRLEATQHDIEYTFSVGYFPSTAIEMYSIMCDHLYISLSSALLSIQGCGCL